MANTTWNPSDKAAGITLSGGNLVATWASGIIGALRAIDKQITGKFYWEVTYNTANSVSSGVGVASSTSLLSAAFNTANVGTAGLNRGGAIWVDGVSVSTAIGAWSSGAVICHAVDAGARLMWLRLGAAGNWNGVTAANPATGVGGISINVGGGIPLYPSGNVAASGDQFIANFGDTAFTGTVPSGFTSGFTAGASIPTNALASQISAEHWLTTSPQAQVTQIAAEHWATVTGTGVQAVVTQVAIEHWARVAIRAGGPIVTMIG
jgi:hypothetical protein